MSGRKVRFTYICVVLCTFLLGAERPIHGAPSVAEKSALMVGAAKVDLTPKDLKGLYSVWATRFTGVHDPIYARALVIQNGSARAAIVSTDLVEFGDTTALRERIQRELGIPADHIIVSATHDHNAPRGGPIVPGSSSAEGRPYSPQSYIDFVNDRVVEAVKNAQTSLQPARIGVGTGHADINVNRNGFINNRFGGADPDGPSDKTVWVVKCESLSGETIAILMNYAVHSVVAGPANTMITGDLAGAAERIVESRYGGKTVALWTMGPAGDQNPKYMSDQREKDPEGKFAYEAMDAQGLIVAVEVMQTANRIKQMESQVAIQAAESTFSCAMVPPKPRPANAGPSPFAPNPDFKEVIPRPAAMDIHLNLIEINKIALAGVSGEIFTRIYWRLKRESPLSNIVLVTMSNGRIGYLADDAEYSGPFTNPSVVAGCSEDGIVNGFLSMMQKLQ